VARKRSQSRLQHDNLKVFRQHGFRPEDEAGDNQVVGICPFCGSGRKSSFYINVENKNWDCKVCNLEGGYQVFLQEMASFCKENISLRKLQALSNNRRLRISTLKEHEIGWNPNTDAYVIPEWDTNREKLWDLRIYGKDKVIKNSAGCIAGLYGWDDLVKRKNDLQIVWLVEGEWDKMTMYEILHRLKIDDHCVVSVPGAGTFKTDWIGFFNDLPVNVVYDNDFYRQVKSKTIMGAGMAGAIKVYKMLATTTDGLQFIHWPEDFKDKFDLRDLYIRKNLSPRRTFNTLQNYLKDKPKDIEKLPEEQGGIPKKRNYSKEGMLPNDLYKSFGKYLKWKNNNAVDVIYGTVIGNRLDGDPIWLYIVGDSGSGKSEVIMSLKDDPGILAISSLTPHTLISGANFTAGNDPSLIPELDGKILTVKDFTTILEMNPTQRAEIVSILRDAYDGECSKPFGNAVRRVYISKFGVIAGVTGVIEIFSEGMTALGERFIKFIMPVDRSMKWEYEVCSKVMENIKGGNKAKMRTELRSAGKRTLDFDFGKAPGVSKKIEKKIISLAMWTAMMRGTITRDKRTNEINHRAFKEVATRLTIEFTKQCMGMALFHRQDEILNEQFQIVKGMGRGTAPYNLGSLVHKMFRAGKYEKHDLRALAKFIKLPSMTVRTMVQDLQMLGVLIKIDLAKMDKFGNKNQYKLSEKFLTLTSDSEIYERSK
jgi:hypothetical protein